MPEPNGLAVELSLDLPLVETLIHALRREQRVYGGGTVGHARCTELLARAERAKASLLVAEGKAVGAVSTGSGF